MSLTESISKVGASGATLIVWGLTTVMILGAVNEARLLVTSRQQLEIFQAAVPPSIEVKDVPVGIEEYETVAQLVKQMHPQLVLTADKNNKTIISEAKDLNSYYEWLISIYDIMTAIPNARWTTQQMCAGEGCTGNKYKIVMTAVRREINVPQASAEAKK